MNKRGKEFCRGCNAKLDDPVLSLGNQPLSNALPSLDFQGIDPKFPLEFRVCSQCALGQIGEFVSPEAIFSDYTYFSSTSSSWLQHAKDFSLLARQKLDLVAGDLIIEIASNDGYLLQYFQEIGCKVLGIEPAANVAEFANSKGISTRVEFFGLKAAEGLVARGEIPKLVVGNNVMAHVPDIKDIVSGLALLAKHGAVISIEAPSMLVMLRDNLFDTIYHEHFSYLSVTAVALLANNHKLSLFDVEILPTHGGSYRYWLGSEEIKPNDSVSSITTLEHSFGIGQEYVHQTFSTNSRLAIEVFGEWVDTQKRPLTGYGAAAKATVLLNAAGIRSESFSGIADNSLSKQNRFVPGCRIPIFSPEEVLPSAVGNIVIFPWNIAREINEGIKSQYPGFLGETWVALPSLTRLN